MVQLSWVGWTPKNNFFLFWVFSLVDAIIFFLPPFVCFTALIVGFSFKNYIITALSGLGFLSFSAATFISPVADLSVFTNVIIGSLYFAFGAYLFLVSSIEWIQENM